MSTIVSRYVSGPIRSDRSIVISQIPQETGAVAMRIPTTASPAYDSRSRGRAASAFPITLLGSPTLAVRWGVLSTARINDLVLAGARKSDRVRFVAVGSRDRARAELYARENGLERAYGSYQQLVDDPEIEAVYISLPNDAHVEWSIRALRSGKHVLCEKPLTRHPEEAAEAFDVAEREGRLLMEAFMWLHNPQ